MQEEIELYEQLTSYASEFDPSCVEYGERNWRALDNLCMDIHAFIESQSSKVPVQYQDVLEKSGIKWEWNSMVSADPSSLDGQTVACLILAAYRADRFSEGIILRFERGGYLYRWLKRLEEIDREAPVF